MGESENPTQLRSGQCNRRALVHVVEPTVGVVVIEVAPARPHLMLGLGVDGVRLRRIDHHLNKRVDIVVVAAWVVLHLKR